MAKDSTGLLLLAGAAGVVYYGYTKGWFASFGFAPVAATAAGSTAATGGTVAAPSTPTSTQAPVTAPAASAAPYSGPSLAQMFSALQSAVQRAYGSDSALTCGGAPGGPALSGLGITRTSPIARPNPTLASGLVHTAESAPAAPASCANPYATYDVFNWYLVNRANVGISTPPNASDHTSIISLTDYWAWAAPQLQGMIPGLAGLGSVYAGLGRLVREVRGW